MAVKTLLLDKIWQPIAFISFRKMVKLLAAGKAELITPWENYEDIWAGQQYPATMRLKTYVRRRPRAPRFNRKNIFRRDKYTCQYTGKIYSPGKLTIDHVIPKDQGGKNTWENCVTASLEANAQKANRTPEQAGMKLIKKPTVPAHMLSIEYNMFSKKNIHPSWIDYFPEIQNR
ncbi:MAG: HNH endonuclease [Thioploca sp.]|nr:HNH endonuclease [Thioploca sp.]